MTPDSPAPVPPDGEKWDASNCVRFCDRCDAEYGITAGADAGDDACAGCGNLTAPHIYPHPRFAAGRAAASPDPPTGLPKGEKCPTCGLTRWEGKQIDGWLKAGPVAAATPDPPDAADLVAAHLRERWPCTCRPGMDGGGVYHAADCNSRREGSQAVLAVIRLLRAANPPASPDERLREAATVLVERAAAAVCQPGQFRDNVGEAQWRLSDAITATRAALAAADREQTCAACGGSGDRNGNRRAADPFGTCPGCGGTGNVAAADREAPDKTRKTSGRSDYSPHGHTTSVPLRLHPPAPDEPKETTT